MLLKGLGFYPFTHSSDQPNPTNWPTNQANQSIHLLVIGLRFYPFTYASDQPNPTQPIQQNKPTKPTIDYSKVYGSIYSPIHLKNQLNQLANQPGTSDQPTQPNPSTQPNLPTNQANQPNNHLPTQPIPIFS